MREREDGEEREGGRGRERERERGGRKEGGERWDVWNEREREEEVINYQESLAVKQKGDREEERGRMYKHMI